MHNEHLIIINSNFRRFINYGLLFMKMKAPLKKIIICLQVSHYTMPGMGDTLRKSDYNCLPPCPALSPVIRETRLRKNSTTAYCYSI